MLIRWCSKPGATERHLADALATVPGGIAFVGLLLPGERGVEIDALVVQRQGLTTIEAKWTHAPGRIEPHANGAWTVGGAPADFAHGPNPLAQARRQAQRVRHRCDEHGLVVGFIPGLVVVGGGATLAPVEVMSGMWATDLAHLPQALASPRRSRPLDRSDVVRLMALLDLGADVPDDDALAAAGFAPPRAAHPAPQRSRTAAEPAAYYAEVRARRPAYVPKPARPAWVLPVVVFVVLLVLPLLAMVVVSVG